MTWKQSTKKIDPLYTRRHQDLSYIHRFPSVALNRNVGHPLVLDFLLVLGSLGVTFTPTRGGGGGTRIKVHVSGFMGRSVNVNNPIGFNILQHRGEEESQWRLLLWLLSMHILLMIIFWMYCCVCYC